MSRQAFNAECIVFTALAVWYALVLLLRRLQRPRPRFLVFLPLAVGYVLRLLAIAVASLSGVGSTLRGGDERLFVGQAQQLASLGWGSPEWLLTNHTSFLHVLVFAGQIKLLGSPEAALRITQVGISLAGALLIAAAVYDIAGPRAARLTTWVLSLEVASVFFSSALHKEPLMELSSGLVVLGATKVWNRLELLGVAMMVAGGLIALGTRQYVGWFVLAAALLVMAHASLRQLRSRSRALPMLYAAIAIALLGTPTVIQATSPGGLRALQFSQNSNATTTAGNGGANGNNLALPPVDFSTRTGIITNLPLRIRDLLLRPYPWQVADVNQAAAVPGSLIALTCWVLLVWFAFRSRGRVFLAAAPILYPFGFLLLAYALSVGNAGTGFRYRTHLVTLALAAILVLRATSSQKMWLSDKTARTPTGPFVAFSQLDHPATPAT